jgi:translation initiation factor 6
MNLLKRNINGNSYVGAFSASSEKLTLISNGVSPKDESIIRENLATETHRLSINGSNLIGIYAVLNSNGVLLPEIAYAEEMRELNSLKERIRIGALPGDMNALGNNILANDKIAIINPNFDKSASDMIADVLDVEIIRMSIGGYETVGANNILTNNGMVLNNFASDKELDMAKDLVGNVSQSTANTGSVFIGLASVANTKGLIVGEDTTGFELARMEEGLTDQ